MIDHHLTFQLPTPWTNEEFKIERLGPLNFLVGPNGSGKSRFAEALRHALPDARLLGTDRLRGMTKELFPFLGDSFTQGIAKNHSNSIIAAGRQGAALDTFFLLEERPDIRIIVEATLSQLFDRKIYLEWDSGYLVPKASLGSSTVSYRIDREECHGIKELMILLAHLYNDEYSHLIIDEPELNLHPQFQAFFMQEARKVAGAPEEGSRTKILILITHSPFIIDLRTIDDLQSIFSFDLKFSTPKRLSDLSDDAEKRLSTLVPRLNVHHKQLFFSDNPIFVEGIFDAQLIEAIEECRNMSITAAGSCIIEANGCDEVNQYLILCRQLHKSAFFFYDLDSLFTGSLRQCIKSDIEISGFLADLGLGTSFAKYCGELDRLLTSVIKAIRQSDEPTIGDLKTYLDKLANGSELSDRPLQKARVATLIKLARSADALKKIVGDCNISDIQGRLKNIVSTLQRVNVVLLPGGALEHYLPSYNGDPYELTEAAKRSALQQELNFLAAGQASDLKGRYRELFDSICMLPAKPSINTDAILKEYLSDYIHEFQRLTISHPTWFREEFTAHFEKSPKGLGKLFTIKSFERGPGADEFQAEISISGPAGVRISPISDKTNAGMLKFNFEPEPKRDQSREG